MFSAIRISLFVGLLLIGTILCTAQRNPEKEQQIRRELERLAPSAVVPFQAGTEAMDKQDFQTARKHFELARREAPDYDVILRRLGYIYTQIGKHSEGVTLLEAAVQKKRSGANLSSLVEALAFPQRPLQATPADKARAFTLAQQAEALESDAGTLALLAQLSLELDKPTEFQQALQTLQQNHPAAMQTHYFLAIQAAQNSNWITAENEIKAAAQLGLPPEAVAALMDSGIGWRATLWRVVYWSAGIITAWLVGLLLLFVLGKVLSAQVLRSVTRANPNETASVSELRLRHLYRRLIQVASIYYYLSIPLVMLLVLGSAGGVVYFFLLIGQIPIKLVGLIVIGALLTVYVTLSSFFTRIQRSDPGRALHRDEAPALWKLVDEVAQQVGTRCVDEIRLTPGTEMAVYENGNARQIKQDRGQRVLLLGIGTLNEFRQAAFRAVLAHEYGHFSHRDTAGGEVALQVNTNMMLQAQALIESEQATPWNIAFQFLRVYHFLFRRISYGATRLQEILADRVAARHYGAAAFREGLTHVIRRTLEFEHLANKEINAALQSQRALVNLYQLQIATDDVTRQVEEQLQEVLQRPTTEDDTHPAPHERFTLVAQITAAKTVTDDGLVWELFADPQALTEEMSQQINAQLCLPQTA